MRSICLLLMVVLGNAKGDGQVWLKDLISLKGWDLGYGVVLRLNESNKGKDVPLTERLTLDINLGDLVGVSVGKAKSEGIELDFYVKKNLNYLEEGRGKKNEENNKYMIPMVMGYKSAILLTGMFGMIKLITMKAVFLAKIALLISLYVLLLKFKHHKPAEIVEVEQLEYPVRPPIYYPSKGYGGSSFHSFGGVGSYGGGNSANTVGEGGGGNYGHTYGNEAQGSDTYQDVVYAPSTQGSAISENNSPYIPVTNNDQGNVRNVERDNPYFDKMLGANSGNSLLTNQKYISPES